LLILAGLLCASCAGERPVRAPRPWNVLLITLDTCRSDVLGCYRGRFAAVTPAADSLAAKGVLFERAYCQAPSTLPSHASILTGFSPLTHGINDNGVYFLGPEFETLAETLKEHGYQTAAFVSAYVLDDRYGLAQGFDVYDDEMEDPLRPGEAPSFPEGTDPQIAWWVSRFFQPYQRTADRVGARAIDWLRTAGSAPFFLWAHFFDPHQPYTPPEAWLDRYAEGYDGFANGSGPEFLAAMRAAKADRGDLYHMWARYSAEVAFADYWVGRLLEVLDESDLWENTIVVLVGDHGEGFGEHGLFFEHNSLLYEELVRVPLLVHVPGNGSAGRRVAAAVRTIDIFPTILSSVGIAPSDSLEGRSLIDLMHGREEAERCSYFQALCGRQALPAREELRGLQAGRWKLIRTTSHADGESTTELYDLANDPDERNDLASSVDSVMQQLDERLRDLVESAAGSGDTDHSLQLDEESRERLRSLGYIR